MVVNMMDSILLYLHLKTNTDVRKLLEFWSCKTSNYIKEVTLYGESNTLFVG